MCSFVLMGDICVCLYLICLRADEMFALLVKEFGRLTGCVKMVVKY